jgi:hypothetical protein
MRVCLRAKCGSISLPDPRDPIWGCVGMEKCRIKQVTQGSKVGCGARYVPNTHLLIIPFRSELQPTNYS